MSFIGYSRRQVVKINGDNTLRPHRSEKKSMEARKSSKIAVRRALSDAPLSNYHDILRKAKTRMEAQHSVFVLSQLREASARSNNLRNGLPNSRDDIDKFMYLRHLERDAILTIDPAMARINENLPAHLAKSVPRFKNYTRITKSFLVEDNHQLTYEPYINETEAGTEAGWREDLHDAYRDLPNPTATYQGENISRLKDAVRQTLEEVGLHAEQVRHDINIHSAAGNSIDTWTLSGVQFMFAFEEVFEMALEDVILDTKNNNPIDDSSNDPKKTKKFRMMENMLGAHLTACPLCGVHGCGAHGDYESSDDEGTIANTRYCDLNMPFDRMLQRHNEKQAASKAINLDACFNNDKVCSSRCFLHVDSNIIKDQKWTLGDLEYLECLTIGLESGKRASCVLAPLLGRSCFDIYDKIRSKLPIIEDFLEEPRRPESFPRQVSWYDNKTKTITSKAWKEKTISHLHERRRQPYGCDHKGLACHEAGKQCHCFYENTLCDKFCSCSDDCHLKFTGCNCSRDENSCSLNSETCVCQLLNRECDADLCHTCGVKESANPFERHEKSTSGCSNAVIQQCTGVSLLVGESQVSGFGAFLGEPTKQEQYIGEYVGEIISREEGDRRSVIYDQFKISYFFTLNEDKLIDGYRFGNTTRFINHGRKNKNCYCQVKLVNGEHRIGFFALKDMPAGTELLFDYGKDFLNSHKLRDVTLPQGDEEKKDKKKSQIKGAIKGSVEVETSEGEEGDLNECDILDQILADVPEYDTDEYEEREGRRRDRGSRRYRRDNDSNGVRQRERPPRRATVKPIRYTL